MKTELLPSVLRRYHDKIATADAAVRLIQPGQHVFVGTACATPRTLVAALEAMPTPPADVELLHFLTTGAVAHDTDGSASTRFRHRTFFVGSDMRAAVKQGVAEYVPISIAHLPRLIEIGRIQVDVALIQVSLPDEFGYVSLGVSVDIIPAAVRKARLVIAEVNPEMPHTMGYSSLHVSEIDSLVVVDTPVTEYVHAPADSGTSQQIARYIAGIIDDGSTLQIGLGRIPNEALKYLEDRRDLAIHSDVITDSIIPLLEKGILSGRHKTHQRGKIAASMVLGTRRLYDLIDRNPLFSLQSIDMICDPGIIAAQHKMVSVTQALALDLTGQVCSDQFDGEFYSGVAAQGEFLRGAARSEGGKAIICLTSTTDDGTSSRIRPVLLAGEGVAISRSDVHYIITEYGIAYLFGLSIRERAVALIGVAHPKFRPWLLEEASKLGYLPPDQTLNNLQAYPVEDERTVALKNGNVVMLRPAIAADAAGVRSLFHRLPVDDVYTRFFRRVRALSNVEVQRLCNVDYGNNVAFAAVHGTRENETIVGHACYFVNPTTNLAETAFMMHPEWQSTGLGTAMQRRLMEHAKQRGVRGFEAEILPANYRMVKLARNCCEQVTVEKDEEVVHITMLF
jgi:acyl-CoA hydrolase/RimJ/RimL family protein N-acetyltransferase